ncbi:MAG: ABC transporter permease [Egibacteraceae bacterium]
MRRLAVRIGQYALVLWVATTLNFLLPHLAPGDPIEYLFAGETVALDQKALATLRGQYGLDGSLAEQYVAQWRDLVRGDLGTSVLHNRPVAAVVADRVPWTLALVGVAAFASTLIGTLAGVAAAWRRGSRRDVGAVSAMLAVDALPSFWIGMILIAVFAVELGWFPSFGAVAVGSGGAGAAWLEVARRLVLPATTIALATVGGAFLLARAAMLATVDEPYVLMAEAKGVSRRGVVYRHALRNALLPIYTHLGLEVGALLSGAVVVETVFAYPGLGRLIYDAVIARDYPLLQGAFLLTTVGVVAANLAVDLTYPLLDPRSRAPRPHRVSRRPAGVLEGTG